MRHATLLFGTFLGDTVTIINACCNNNNKNENNNNNLLNNSFFLLFNPWKLNTQVYVLKKF